MLQSKVQLMIMPPVFCAGQGEDDGKGAFMYYVNDGAYGSFNCLLYDHATVQATLVNVSNCFGVFTSTCMLWCFTSTDTKVCWPLHSYRTQFNW